MGAGKLMSYEPWWNTQTECQVCGTKLINQAQPDDKVAMGLIRHICLRDNCQTPVMCGECFDKHRIEVHPSTLRLVSDKR